MPPASKTPQPASPKKLAGQYHADRRIRSYAMILVGIAIAAFVQTLSFDFTYDDIPIVRDNPLIQSLANIEKIFHTNYWGDRDCYETKYAYRPVTILTYALQYALHGRHPFGYHLVNVLLHALACFLLFRLLALITSSADLAFFASVLFAVHPIHTEAVSGIVGRSEVMAAAGIFLCVWAYFRASESASFFGAAKWLALSIFGFWFGLFSKETGIIAPAVIVLTELLFPTRRQILRFNGRAIAAFAGYGCVVGLFFLLRAQSIVGKSTVLDFADISTAARILTALRVALEYVGLLIFPRTLLADYPPANVHLISGLTDPAVWPAIAAVIGAIAFAIWSWRRIPVACWGLLFFAGSFFPVSNLAFAIGVMKGERLLYTPSAGFLVAAVALLTYLLRSPRNESNVRLAVYVVAGLLLVRTWARNEDWRNNYTLATATLKSAPTSDRMRTVLVNWYREHGQDSLARALLTQGGRSVSGSTKDMYNLANLELDARRYAQAIELYEKVLAVEPDNGSAMNNLGRALVESGQYPQAIEVLEKLRATDPDSPGSYVNLMDLYLRINNPQGALPVVEEGVRRFPSMDAIHWNAGAVYRKLGREVEAQAAFDRAAKMNPEISRQKDVRREL